MANRFSMALLDGRAGRLTAENGGFRPGQGAGEGPAVRYTGLPAAAVQFLPGDGSA